MNPSNQQAENDLHEYLGIILRGKWTILTTLLITVTLATIASFKAKPVFRATAQLLIDKENSSSMAYREGVAIDVGSLDYYQTQYKIMKSRTLAKSVIDELNLASEPEFKVLKGDPIDHFLTHVLIEPIRGSRLVNLSVESFSPELAAKIANTVANTYLKQNLENRLFASREILKKLPANASISSLSNRDIESLPSVVSNPLIQSLKTDLIKFEAEYANLSQRYKPRHPTMLTLKAQINHLQQQIDSETQNTLESIKTELSGEFKANNVRIVDNAEVPDSPVRPQRKRNIMLAFLLGLTMGVGLAFFFEYMDNSIKSGTDIEQYLGLPFLGIVPLIKEKVDKSFIFENNINSPSVEAIKTIRTNLVFSAPEDKLKMILITSCSPGEGKTFVSMNVATSFAHAGKKTLLIDADLRRTTLSKAMELDKSDGLSNYLIGEASLDRIIQETELKNLYFISSGVRAPDPAELLSSEKMKELVLELRKLFDRIIVDSAPVLPVSDTLNISSLMDGIVQVTSHGKSSRQMTLLGKQKLQSVGAKVLGVVLNHVNLKHRTGYYGYSYYSYGEYGGYY